MDRKSLTTLFWVTFSVALITFLFLNTAQEKTIENFGITFLVSAVYCFGLGVGNGLVNDYLTKKYSWIDQTRTRVITGVIGTVLVNIVGVLLINYLLNVSYYNNSQEKFFSGQMMFYHVITINIALLIAAILHAKSFMEEWKKAAKSQVTEQKIIAGSANAQFETLKNQLDPHFLFNSLNVLSALIDENPEHAQRFTASMSKIYRYVLDEKDKELVTVGEELDFARTYCEMLKTRFEDSVDFRFEVADEVKTMYVVPLSLQLLLENAIKHNFATASKPLIIKIYSENQQLIVENNLQAREMVREREGIGLSNIVQRYSLLTAEAVSIDKSEDNFKVKIPILKEKISAMETKFYTETAIESAQKRVLEIKKFYQALIPYCVFIPFFIAVNLLTSPNDIWFHWPMLGWGIAIVLRGIRVFGLSQDWENRQIQKILDKKNK